MKGGSHWLDELQSEQAPFQPLGAALTADVAIVGGGFVGLWTAISLKQLEPSLRVVVLEANRCGSGASGLNGGFVMSWWPKIASLVRVCGLDDAVWLADETTKSVSDLAAFLEQHGVDAEYRQAGWLWTATTPAHVGAWASVVATAQRIGRGETFQQLSPEDVACRTGSHAHIAGICEPVNATIHPGKLGRGLAQIAARLGVAIYEMSRVESMVRSKPAKLVTRRGSVTAEQVVIATNAWAAAVPELRRQFVCVGSAIVATPPIPERLAKMGWVGGESITDSQTTVTYYRTTRDGRIVFGKGGGRIYFSGEPPAVAFNDSRGIAEASADFRRVYPMLADVPIERSWSGPIDRTYDSLPLLGKLDDAPNFLYGVGWSGNGVNPSRIGARILASLLLGKRDRWAENGLVNRKVRHFPPEPVRYLGGSIVRAAMMRKDVTEIAGKSPSFIDSALVRLAPAGLEDKN
jgi:glycine/D-amino acid oxidase-like deaminating enzyme